MRRRNESDRRDCSATRPVPDTDAPRPGGPGRDVGGSGISLDWVDNIESDLAGYNVYRSTSAGGPWTKLNANLLATSSFLERNRRHRARASIRWTRRFVDQ